MTPLTPREIEVLRLLCDGQQNKAAAETLHISVKTVEKFRNSLHQKCHARSVLGLLRYGLKHGIIDFQSWVSLPDERPTRKVPAIIHEHPPIGHMAPPPSDWAKKVEAAIWA